MRYFMIKVFFVLSSFILVPVAVYADYSESSFVALAPDEELCKGSKGHFLPLPSMDSIEASSKYLLSVIDKKFGSNCKFDGLLLKGEITENTLSQLKLGLQILEKRKNVTSILGANTLWLDSQGGILLEAMKIGDLVAEKGMKAIVKIRGSCYSSCVFIYAAAKTRSSLGEVGIHRPFAGELSTENLTYAEYLKKYESLTPILKQYFSKYGVSPMLVDSMNVVSSDDIKILSNDELESFGLGFKNVAAKEYEKARTIQVCGQDYYDMHLRFHGLIESCRKRFGIGVLDEKDEECWGLARQAYPDYSDKFKECKAKQ
ncbi:hypothetical protein [Thiomicrorhabdus xiamenensis]|uniref:Uncharacterized protein n=1 Tax=Thiomicrorhabdus xiamenensis TaxID=2739063 RepID=A0A7D4SMU8_9GAMM|nr:hypothetical protein [Thiomicrorhabdus xiamenensis]QKI88961.1 hypothetical protein HQN79_04935 [Thiomicrorhabdus xiamenensis]